MDGRAQATLPLLANDRFVRYALGKLLQLLGLNSLIYGVFILIVSGQGSSLVTSAYVVTSVLPSILLSLPGGVVADLAPKKPVILSTLILRAAIIWVFFQYQPGLTAIIGLTTLVWTVYQFYSPAESAALPAVAPREQVARATALVHAVSLLSQLMGAGLLAPVALKLLGRRGLFAIVLILTFGSASLFASVSALTQTPGPRGQGTGWLASLPGGLRAIRAIRALRVATTLRVLLDTSFMMLVVAAPVFVDAVLHAPPENTVYIVAPGALGIGLGLFLTPLLTKMASARLVLWLGFVLAVVTVFGLALIPAIAQWLDEGTFLPLHWLQETFGVRREIAATMLLLPLGGFGVSLVQVGARAVVYEAAASEMMAQVFATQSAMGSVAALVPILLAGVLLDLLPVRVVLALIGTSAMVLTPVMFLGLRAGPEET